MIEIVYRYDPENLTAPAGPATPAEARRRLEEGNREFSQLVDPRVGAGSLRPHVIRFDPRGLGMGEETGTAPKQEPFAVVLGCSDARVPIELIFNQGCNELFVVRVAGNVLGNECLGSIDYAIENFQQSLHLLVVLGHSGCGAVTAAVDAFLDPSRYLALSSSHPLRAIVDRLFVAVRAAAQSLDMAWGHSIALHANYRKVLIGMSVVLNAAMTASILRQEFERNQSDRIHVVYGYYDLVDRRIRLPGSAAAEAAAPPEVGLVDPPADQEGFNRLGIRLALCDLVSDLLGPRRIDLRH